MTPSIIFIRTKDAEFSEALRDLNIDGIHRSHVVQLTQPGDWSKIIQHIVEFSAEHGADSFFAWLLSQLKKRKPRETTINKREIPSDDAAIDGFLEIIKNDFKSQRNTSDNPQQERK